MKLYIYEHCPFCVRARMPFGLKGIPVEIDYILNDDAETPIGMTGEKSLPILQDQDGYMGESLDIVRKVDHSDGNPILTGEPRPEIKDWLSDWFGLANTLIIPRIPDPAFPEFRTEAARTYFKEKKEEQFGAFDDLLAKQDENAARMEEGLTQLEGILPDPEGASMDDIHLFPVLRSLSILPHLPLRTKVLNYRDRMSERSGVPLLNEVKAAA